MFNRHGLITVTEIYHHHKIKLEALTAKSLMNEVVRYTKKGWKCDGQIFQADDNFCHYLINGDALK